MTYEIKNFCRLFPSYHYCKLTCTFSDFFYYKNNMTIPIEHKPLSWAVTKFTILVDPSLIIITIYSV